MMRTFPVFAIAAGLIAASCSSAPEEPTGPAPASLSALQEAHDWQWEAGRELDAAWKRGVTALLRPMSRPNAISAIEQAGFTCTYGEAHETYPDPMAVCTRSFATRRCQMDWEISSTADSRCVLPYSPGEAYGSKKSGAGWPTSGEASAFLAPK